jgi:hypothetical protein
LIRDGFLDNEKYSTTHPFSIGAFDEKRDDNKEDLPCSLGRSCEFED